MSCSLLFNPYNIILLCRSIDQSFRVLCRSPTQQSSCWPPWQPLRRRKSKSPPQPLRRHRRSRRRLSQDLQETYRIQPRATSTCPSTPDRWPSHRSHQRVVPYRRLLSVSHTSQTSIKLSSYYRRWALFVIKQLAYKLTRINVIIVINHSRR